MQFKGSKFEVRYNQFWDDTVVLLDKQIRHQFTSPFFFDGSKTLRDINQYYLNVKSIMMNLARQAREGTFTDHDYIMGYIRETEEQALLDLRSYKIIMAGPKQGEASKGITHLIEALQKMAAEAIGEQTAAIVRAS